MRVHREQQRFSRPRIQRLACAALLIVVGTTPSGLAQSGLHADAGPDRASVEGSLVDLDGSGSFDPAGAPLTYRWVQVAGPAFPHCGGGTRYDAGRLRLCWT